MLYNFDLRHQIVPGRHFYQFYKTPEDLLKVLVPFWQFGVKNKNFCFWVVPRFLTIEDAYQLLLKKIPHFHIYYLKGGFELVSHAGWYGDVESFNGESIRQKFAAKIKEGLLRNFQTIRIAGDGSGFSRRQWPLMRDYEHKAQEAMKDLVNTIILCSYPIHELNLQETRDILENHHRVLVGKV